MPRQELTQMQKRFCEVLVEKNNNRQAAIAAGATEVSAHTTANKWLKLGKVQEYVAQLRDAASQKSLVTTEWVINNLKEVAERCMQKQPVMIFDQVNKEMVQKQEEDQDGNYVGVWDFDSSGANKALELLGKHTGAWDRPDEAGKIRRIVVEIE